MATAPFTNTPIIADGARFVPYLEAARANLLIAVALADELHDHEFAKEAQALLDDYDVSAADCWLLIEGEDGPHNPSASFGMRHPDDDRFGSAL